MSQYSSSTTSSDISPIEVLKIPNLLSNITNILVELINKNGKGIYDKKNPFCSKFIPTISIADYLLRFKKYTNIENSTLIIGLIYLDTICSRENIILQENCIHRLLLICCVLAIKFNEDLIFDNEYYAKIGGISLKEINLLEYYAIKFLDFDLFFDEQIYNKYVHYLRNEFKS
jgi:hypothetical protein